MEVVGRRDRALVEAAGAAIRRNYDGENFHHTRRRGRARCGGGNVYTGVNVYSIHGACAEQVAIGSAITNGERVLKQSPPSAAKDGSELLPPVRQLSAAPGGLRAGCEVILPVNEGCTRFRQRICCPSPLRKPNRIHYHSSRRSFPYERTVSNHPLGGSGRVCAGRIFPQNWTPCGVKYLGKKGELTAVLKQMGKLSAEAARHGPASQRGARRSGGRAGGQGRELEAKALEARLEAEALDVTVPGKPVTMGHRHPMYIALDELRTSSSAWASPCWTAPRWSWPS